MNDFDKKAIVKTAQLERLLSVSLRTLIASSLCALLLAFMQRGVIDIHILYAWLSAMLGVNLVRIVLSYYYSKNATTDPSKISIRLNQFRIGVIISAVLWGSSGILLFPENYIQHQMYLIFILTGLSASAVISYSIDKICALSYIFLLLVPIICVMFLNADSVALALEVAGIIYLIFMVLSIRNFHEELIDGIILRHEAIIREADIKQLAFYDALTNLPNRRLLLDRLTRALAMSARTNQRGALLFLDLDHFKVLNDALGHEMGDLLLKQVAERISACVRDTDTVARLGGDEFVIMLEGLSADANEAETQVENVTKLIIQRLNHPFKLNNYHYECTSSIGIALFGEHGHSHDDLLRNADIAMYKAKKAGRNAARMFEFNMQ